MVERREFVADVVHECGDHPIDVGTVEACPGRRLERVLEPRDAIPAERTGQPVERLEDAIREARRVHALVSVEQRVFVSGAVSHRRERHLTAGEVAVERVANDGRFRHADRIARPTPTRYIV